MSSDFPAVIILAGGTATRLGALSQQIPKAMVVVAGAPFIDHQLRLLAEKGITKAILSVAHLSDQIENFVGDGKKYGLEIKYVHDGPHRLGTGGAIKAALHMVPDDFAVLYGDTFLDIDYKPVFTAYKNSCQRGLMTVLLNDNNWDKSNVRFQNGIIEVYSKTDSLAGMRHIDYGLSILSKKCFEDFPEGQNFDLTEVFQHVIGEGQMAGYEVQKRFFEIGTPSSLLETEAYLKSRRSVILIVCNAPSALYLHKLILPCGLCNGFLGCKQFRQ